MIYILNFENNTFIINNFVISKETTKTQILDFLKENNLHFEVTDNIVYVKNLTIKDDVHILSFLFFKNEKIAQINFDAPGSAIIASSKIDFLVKTITGQAKNIHLIQNNAGFFKYFYNDDFCFSFSTLFNDNILNCELLFFTPNFLDYKKIIGKLLIQDVIEEKNYKLTYKYNKIFHEILPTDIFFIKNILISSIYLNNNEAADWYNKAIELIKLGHLESTDYENNKLFFFPWDIDKEFIEASLTSCNDVYNMTAILLRLNRFFTESFINIPNSHASKDYLFMKRFNLNNIYNCADEALRRLINSSVDVDRPAIVANAFIEKENKDFSVNKFKNLYLVPYDRCYNIIYKYYDDKPSKFNASNFIGANTRQNNTKYDRSLIVFPTLEYAMESFPESIAIKYSLEEIVNMIKNSEYGGIVLKHNTTEFLSLEDLEKLL